MRNFCQDSSNLDHCIVTMTEMTHDVGESLFLCCVANVFFFFSFLHHRFRTFVPSCFDRVTHFSSHLSGQPLSLSLCLLGKPEIKGMECAAEGWLIIYWGEGATFFGRVSRLGKSSVCGRCGKLCCHGLELVLI